MHLSKTSAFIKQFHTLIILEFCLNAIKSPGADPGFFSGGSALVSCSTSTPISHIVFFFGRIPVVLGNRRSSQGGRGVRTPYTLPLDPPLIPHPTLESILFVVEERLGGRGGGSTKGRGQICPLRKKGAILNTFVPHCSLSLLEVEKYLDVMSMTKSFISLTVNCRVDINHPLLTGWREGRSPSAKANYARKFSKSKSSKGEYFPSMGYCK